MNICKCGHGRNWHTKRGDKCRWLYQSDRRHCGCTGFEDDPSFPTDTERLDKLARVMKQNGERPLVLTNMGANGVDIDAMDADVGYSGNLLASEKDLRAAIDAMKEMV